MCPSAVKDYQTLPSPEDEDRDKGWDLIRTAPDIRQRGWPSFRSGPDGEPVAGSGHSPPVQGSKGSEVGRRETT